MEYIDESSLNIIKKLVKKEITYIRSSAEYNATRGVIVDKELYILCKESILESISYFYRLIYLSKNFNLDKHIDCSNIIESFEKELYDWKIKINNFEKELQKNDV